MSIAIAQAVGDSMRRARELQQQRQAVAILLQRYNQAPTMCQWGRAVLRSDEIRRYPLLYVIAERGA